LEVLLQLELEVVAPPGRDRERAAIAQQRRAVKAPERERQGAGDEAIRQLVEHDAAGDVDRVPDCLPTAGAHEDTAWVKRAAGAKSPRNGKTASTRARVAQARSIWSSVVSTPTLQRVAVTARHGSSG